MTSYEVVEIAARAKELANNEDCLRLYVPKGETFPDLTKTQGEIIETILLDEFADK